MGSEFDEADALLDRSAGVRPRLVRPPYGHKTPWWLAGQRRRGRIVVTWSLAVNDYSDRDGQVIAARAVDRARPGDIILLHDGNARDPLADRSATISAVPHIIAGLRAKGFSFVTVAEMLNVAAYQPILSSSLARSRP